MRLAVLASHGGSLLQAVLDAQASRRLAIDVVTVISNNSKSRALQRAREAGVTALHLSSKHHSDPGDLDQALCDALTIARADWVLLAGYMRPLGKRTMEQFQGRIINVHPSLLPKYGGQGYYGRYVHEAVLAAGDTQSGATVHQVEGGYDSGPIMAQVTVAVTPGDTVDSLQDRVQQAERKLLIETLVQLTQARKAS